MPNLPMLDTQMPTGRIRVWLLVASVLLTGGRASAEPLDTLSTPTLASRLASRSLLLAAARAGDRIVVAGERGHVLWSDDSGAQWRQARVPVSVTLTAMCFTDARTGWAVGHRGAVLKTDDGGETWQLKIDGRNLNRMIADAARNMPEAVPLEARGLADEGADKPWLGVTCLDRERAFVFGAFGLGVATRDGGRSWSLLTDLMAGAGQKHLYAAAVRGADIVLAGEQGQVLRLPSNGRHVQRLPSSTQGSLFGIVMTPERELLAFGLRGRLLFSNDGGQSWSALAAPSAQTLSAGLVRADGSVLLADETGTLFLAAHAGGPYQPLARPDTFPLAAMIEDAVGGVVAVGLRGVIRLTDLPRATAAGGAPGPAVKKR